jgi:hypothetical protein
MRKWVLGILLVLLFTPSRLSAQKVAVDYDESVTFSKYKTYMWIRGPAANDPLMKKRIKDAVDAALSSKGLVMVDHDADLGVAAHMATREKRTIERFYEGWGPWAWRWGPGVVRTEVNTYPVGTIVVDLFDAQTKQLVWRGVARDVLADDPQKNTKKLHKAVEKMFGKFPPKSKQG